MHAKHFQICGHFLQIFPKIPLAVSWKINGLQGEKGNFAFSEFSRRSPTESPDPAPPARRVRRRAIEKA
jgi:hypothetical protein